ncbi:dienelactone hydrolase family protein [Methylocystis bryophila]|uniref:Carboxymethylenebutenolidase n=1 Tax=Methylocystis bryophila TaxID=655015 RepID=A0A1W6MTU3_9HYPH|nr:alpha/beta fold hydrolase [Methylocystis bryophila]ARN81014.1 carboxymethylenebutenolidase [Methylocystis bryophila]BDV36931.1 carboxymethylenebutenolidase [Methylocystis bryophila]
MIELTSGDGHSFSAYRADPSEAPKGAVVVLQDFSGVGAHIQKEVDAFAARGYVAIAPLLFQREHKQESVSEKEGVDIAKAVTVDSALLDVQAAIDSVKSAGKVAVVGYSWGGYLAYQSANHLKDIACTIAYYAAGLTEGRTDKRRVPTLLHFPEDDPSTPLDGIVAFRALRPDVSAFSYPKAKNGFNFETAETFDATAAEQAKERTLFWISQFVEGQPPVTLKNSGAYAQAKTEKKKKKASGDDDMGPPMD